ncbi:MAG TPA: hypothetical protein VLT32_22470 [Candidatus Sulfomarinibacteraceae bacterium]|nr:hypothetical protein [Candidatus Sulfomarinibacteraceae bacterium]
MGLHRRPGRISRWVLGAIATLVVLVAGFVAFVVYPVPLYRHHRQIGRFSVYSDLAITPADESAVEEAERTLAAGELDTPEDRFRIFLSSSSRKYAFFCAVARRGVASQAVVFTRARSIIISLDGIGAIRARSGGRPPNSRLEGSLAFAIAHEAAHIEAASAVRRRGLPQLPTWLSEGWADYTAGSAGLRGDPPAQLPDRARLVFDDAAWVAPLLRSDRRHFRWHVSVEYLATVRGLGFDDLATGAIGEGDAERDLRRWMTTTTASLHSDGGSASTGAADHPGGSPTSAFNAPDRAHELFLRERLSPSVPAYPIRRLSDTLAAIETREADVTDGRKRGVGSIRMEDWQGVGPGNIGGRTRALAIDPVDPEIIYAGGVSGGVWKSTDGGAGWTPTDDLMANLAVTTIAIDPVDPKTLYAGTGEGFFWPYSMARGLGVFKSTDAGGTWNRLEGTVTGVADGAFHYVHDIEISPFDHRRLFAATQFGVWKSEDGGVSWTVVLANPRFVSGPSTSRGSMVGCTDIAVRKDAGREILLAAFGVYEADGLYRSGDGGETWQRVLTTDIQGRMTVAFAPSDPKIAYVCMAANTSGEFGKLVDVFRSTNGGRTWVGRVEMSTRLGPWLLSNSVYATRCAQDKPTYHQGWYDNVIAVDPVDPDSVWVGGIDLFRSDDGGRNFHPASFWWAPEFPHLVDDLYVHADHHVLRFHPFYDGVSNQTLYSGSDGGLYRTDAARAPTTPEECPFAPNPVFSEITWTDINNSYAVTQFYHGDAARIADTIVGGSQDNGTVLVDSLDRPNEWRRVWAGDGGYVAFDPRDDNVFFIEEQGFPTIVKTVDGGRTFAPASAGITDNDGLFIVPFTMDPSNPDVLWTGGSRPWRTTNGAAGWTLAGPSFGGEISAIAVAPTDGDIVYIGLDSGAVWFSDDALSTTPHWRRRDNGLPAGWISSLAVDPVDPQRAYCTISTFGVPHVLRTDDGGRSWSSIDGLAADGIPDIPCHWIAVRPCNRDQLFVGSELGVFASDDGGGSWEPANSGLAHTVVEALDFKDESTLIAFTRGRGAFITRLYPCSPPPPRLPGGRIGP